MKTFFLFAPFIMFSLLSCEREKEYQYESLEAYERAQRENAQEDDHWELIKRYRDYLERFIASESFGSADLRGQDIGLTALEERFFDEFGIEKEGTKREIRKWTEIKRDFIYQIRGVKRTDK